MTPTEEYQGYTLRYPGYICGDEFELERRVAWQKSNKLKYEGPFDCTLLIRAVIRDLAPQGCVQWRGSPDKWIELGANGNDYNLIANSALWRLRIKLDENGDVPVVEKKDPCDGCPSDDS